MSYLKLEYIALMSGIVLMLIGLWGLLSRKNLIRIVIGFSLLNTGVHVLMVALSYLPGRTAPILDKAVDAANAVNEITDPLPQALVLTAIVIGLGVTSLMLAYVMRMYQSKKSLEINDYKDLKW